MENLNVLKVGEKSGDIYITPLFKGASVSAGDRKQDYQSKETIFVFIHQLVMKLHGFQKIKSACLETTEVPRLSLSLAHGTAPPNGRSRPWHIDQDLFLTPGWLLFRQKNHIFTKWFLLSAPPEDWGASKLTPGAKRLYTFVISFVLHLFFRWRCILGTDFIQR